MKSKKVLIVEDNDLNRKLFENLIGQYWSYKSAINGIEAINLLNQETFDLILMDIQMPKMDGITALKKIRQLELSNSPVVAVSAYAEEFDKAEFLQMGFNDFLTKPIRTKRFLEILKIYLETGLEEISISDEIEVPNVLLDQNVVSQLMKYNSKETVKKVLNDFALELTKLVEKYHKVINSKNTSELAEIFHTLKGNSGTIGANSIYLIAIDLESFTKKKEWPEVEKLFSKLEKEKKLFENFIKEATIFEL
ncbi:MAG: response regulator [Algoriphagus sp.]|uniref:response regulator n=1 Tax=Algoriphagus sp. TaxID=1872435 RepID=UPI00262F92E5|nr:hybrid sensor histidine kinase/response regulator [Algoriphagus sp.]MDG1277377.1 response regulator [Algoriphagus sp.]